MADNDQPARLEAATIKAEAGSQIVSDFANLPADQTVATASGNIPTLAGVIGEIQNEGDQAAADVRAKADAQVQAAIGTLVKKAGDTMTGPLVLSGNPTQSLQASPKQYVDSRTAYQLPDPSNKANQGVRVNAAGNGYELRNDLPAPSSATAGQAVLVNTAGNGFVSAAIPFTKEYLGNQATLQGSSALSYAHGFGVVPKLVTLELIAIATASGGYVVGDIVEIGTFGSSAYSGSVNQHSGFVVTKDESIIIVRVSPNIHNLQILTKSGNGYTTIAIQGNWSYRVRAFA